MLRKSILVMAIAQFFIWTGSSFAEKAVSVAPTTLRQLAPDRSGEFQVAQAQTGTEVNIGRRQNKVDANAGTVSIITTRNLGAPFMTATLDLSTLLDSGERYEDMRVIPVVARGKEQNLWDILYLKGIDAGFVQTDILSYLADDPRVGSIKQRLRFICVMFPEEVHIIARKEIKTLADLAGKKVSINARGTGSSVVGTVLFKRLGIDAIVEHEDTNRAIARMKEGDLYAHFNVLAKPARPVLRIKKGDGLHLLPIPHSDEIAELYFPSNFTSEDYPELVPEGTQVQTISAGNVLAVFNWPEDHPRYKKVARFVNSFFDNFEKLKQPGFHPKWKDVNLAANVAGWTRFKAAQEWLDKNAQAKPLVAGTAQLQQEFNAFVAQPGILSAGASANDSALLFEEFLKWRKSRQKQ